MRLKPNVMIFTVCLLMCSCSTVRVWVAQDIDMKNNHVAFAGFDIKQTVTNKYSKELDNQISDGLNIFFLQSGFKVIERKKIDLLTKEIEFQLSGYTDEATAVKLGKLVNANYVILGSGSYEITGGSPFIKQFNLKMVSVGTGNTVIAATWHGAGVHLGSCIDQIGEKILKELNKVKTK